MTVASAVRPGSVGLSDREFQELREFLYDRSGLVFRANQRLLLEGRLAQRLEATASDSVAAYLGLLRSPVKGSREVLELLNVVTTHETSFFRNRPQMKAFRHQVLPRALAVARKKGSWRIRIWSAACSSGEEPYTLAMLVLEVLGDEAPRWDVRIVGTDVARSVIDKAKEGEYGPYSFRGTPAYFVQRYFDVLGPDRFRLKAGPRALVDLRVLNFVDELRMGQMRGFQVVFCRNALIYFDRPAKQRFVAHFHRALDPGGYLFVGHSESLHGLSDAFQLIHLPGALGYHKPVPETRET